MPPKSKVELFAAIRRDARVEKLPIRELARRHGVHRRLVREALTSAWPAPRKPLPTRVSVLDPYKAIVDQILRDDLDAPVKQRHTGRRIHQRLVQEFGAEGVSYYVVRDYLTARRPQIWQEAGRGAPQVFITQSSPAGRARSTSPRCRWAGGVPTKCYLFTFRLSFSGRSVHRVFASCGLEAFMEGTCTRLRRSAGCRWPGALRQLEGRGGQGARLLPARVENERWLAFRSHFGLDAFYCLPGKEGAHEKGGVEHEGGWFRRNHLVPVPSLN